MKIRDGGAITSVREDGPAIPPADIRTTLALVGAPVVTCGGEKILGIVDTVLVDRARCRAAGLLLRQGVHEALVVPFSALRPGASPPALNVGTEGDARPLSTWAELRSVWEDPAAPPGAAVMSEGGDLVGTLADYAVDMADGSIVGIDVLIHSRFGERQERIPREALLRLGPELALVVGATAGSGESGPPARAPQRKNA